MVLDLVFILNLKEKGVINNLEVVNDKIFKELQAGRKQGSFSDPPIPSIKNSPLGIVPKKFQGQFRMIHHLSFPDKKRAQLMLVFRTRLHQFNVWV